MFYLITVVLSANELVYINAVLKKLYFYQSFELILVVKKKTVWKLDTVDSR